ncbi:hypothetical protein [Helicobacter pylori]|uniref:hypothetical protein n=1 Tax=Helicobacter pylori TaxID=210 RepID=UPI000FDD6303|nr:hypothetical protein [Helicobacter pylori]RVY22422.1 hypothetical protein ECC09_08080 [Helicobacter pylori]
MMGKCPILENITSDAVMGYIFKKKVIAKDEWFETPFKQVILYNLLVDKHGLINRDQLKSLYLEFKGLTKTQGKRYNHNKMGVRRTKLVSYITNKKLKYIYLSWLKCRGLKWSDIDKALKDLMKHCAISSIEK